ncbi:MAG: alginate export family protein [Leptospira sp.]|jgi:hypothetical protein|nr:alginate export family protein [Leptospira sp.]
MASIIRFLIFILVLAYNSYDLQGQGNVITYSDQEKHIKETKTDSWLDRITLGGLIRFRPEVKNNFSFDRSNHDHVGFTGQKIQFYIHNHFSEVIESKITFQDTRIWGGERGSIATTNTANDLTRQSTDVREAWFKLKNLFQIPLKLQVGRQILAYGDERLVGALEWTNVGRSFDGARLMFDEKYFSSHLWIMALGENNSDIAGNTTALGRNSSYNAKFNCPPNGVTACKLIPDAPKNELGDSYFTGFYNTIKFSEKFHMDLYYLGLQKQFLKANNSVFISTGDSDTPESRSARKDILHTFGIRFTNKTLPGRKALQNFDYSVEYTRQTGTTGSNRTPDWDILNTQFDKIDPLNGKVYKSSLYQERIKYDTYAYAIDFGYKQDSIRYGVGYDVGSGDPNRKDGSVSTFQNLFHTNHIWYGMADQVSWVNMVSKSVNATYYSNTFGTFRIDYFTIDKHSRQDGWYDVSGTIKPGRSTESISNNRFDSSNVLTFEGAGSNRPVSTLGKSLFREIDFLYSVEYKTVNWALGYSVIYAGDSIRNQVDDSSKSTTPFTRKNFSGTAEFAFLMMTYVF